jgi:hypothetical protein
MTIVHDLDLTRVHLLAGQHNENSDQQWCVMEAVAYVAGEPWTDHPKCASQVLGAFCRCSKR